MRGPEGSRGSGTSNERSPDKERGRERERDSHLVRGSHQHVDGLMDDFSVVSTTLIHS